MPILDLGYRNWLGERTAEWSRCLVVARTGISLVWRGTWLKRLLLFATIPALVSMFGIGVYEQGTRDEEFRRMFNRFIVGRNQEFNRRSMRSREIRDWINDTQMHRHLAWSNVLQWYFRYPQALWLVVIVGLIAPRLISYDLRSRGYLLYLSRPLSPAGYVFGKACVLFFLLAMITTVPALVIYAGGLLLSSESIAIWETWDLPFRILLSTAVLVLPTSAVALAFSSMTQESRFAAFAWFAVWIVGWVTYLVLTGSAMLNETDIIELQEKWLLISPYHILGHLQQQIFGLIPVEQYRITPWVVCILTVVVGFGIAHWRVSRMLKI